MDKLGKRGDTVIYGWQVLTVIDVNLYGGIQVLRGQDGTLYASQGTGTQVVKFAVQYDERRAA